MCRGTVTPSEVGLVGINPTFPERVDHRIRVARISTAGTATADRRPWVAIDLLGQGGARVVRIVEVGAGGAHIGVGRVARIVGAGRVARIVVVGGVARIVVAGGVAWVISVVVGAVAAVAVASSCDSAAHNRAGCEAKAWAIVSAVAAVAVASSCDSAAHNRAGCEAKAWAIVSAVAAVTYVAAIRYGGTRYG